MKLSELYAGKKIARKLMAKSKKKTPEEKEQDEKDAAQRRSEKLNVDLTMANIVPNRGPSTNLSHYSNIGGTSG